MSVLVLGLLATIGMGLMAQETCTVTVQPGQSIQAAIDAASPGDVICLSPSEWEENLVIGRSLTLRAAETASEPQAVIRSAREGWPVIFIRSEEPIDVIIQGLKITGGSDIVTNRNLSGSVALLGISVHGKAAAMIDNNTISDNGHDILMFCSSQAMITGNVIRNNEGYGVALQERPCVDTVAEFTGYVTGSGNTGGDNAAGDYCPDGLAFLFTEEGGERVRRE